MDEILSFTVDSALFNKEVVAPLTSIGVADNVVTFTFKNEGLGIFEQDAAHVLMYKFELNKNMLENYENDINDDETVDVSLDIEKLGKYLSGLSGKSKFILNLKRQRLEIQSGIYSYGIGLKARNKRDLHFPKLEYTNDFDVKGSDFSKVISKSSDMSRFVKFAIKSDILDNKNLKVVISATNKDINDSLSIDIGKFDMITNNLKEECLSTIDVEGTDFMKIMGSTIDNLQVVKVFIGESYPLQLKGNIKENKGIVTLLVAPTDNSNS